MCNTSSQAPVDMDLDHEDHPLAMANWSQHSNNTFMKFVIQQQTDSFAPEPGHKQQLSNQQLAGFKKGIKREVTSCPTLKDERYFDSFSRSLYITTISHDFDEVLDPDYTPSTEDKELFENKQIFTFSVINTHLLTGMGETIVRKHVHNTNAQAFWKKFQEHMESLLKGPQKRED